MMNISVFKAIAKDLGFKEDDIWLFGEFPEEFFDETDDIFEDENEGNPNHDKNTGRFTSKNGSSGGEGQEQNKGKQKASKDRPIQIKGDELDEYKHLGNLRKQAIAFYKDKLQGEKVKNKGLEGSVLFSSRGLGKFSYTKATENKLKMVVALKEIIENGNYIGPEELYKERDDGIVRFHRINHFVELKNDKSDKNYEIFEVSALIGEDKDGNKFYNLNEDVEGWKKKKGHT